MGFIAELKRRNVFRVGVAYLVLGWVVIQVTDTVAPTLNLPDWTLALVTWIGIIGFPFAFHRNGDSMTRWSYWRSLRQPIRCPRW